MFRNVKFTNPILFRMLYSKSDEKKINLLSHNKIKYQAF